MEQENLDNVQENAPRAQSTEDRLRKENKMMRIALIVIAGILFVALVCVMAFVVIKGLNQTAAPTEPTGTEAPTAANSNYTVSDEQAIAAADTVVATVGDKKLTNGELSAYYWMQVYDFIGNYGAYYNVDISKPLGEQTYNATTGQTWEELFLEQALNTWNRYIVLQTMGESENFVLTQETKEQLDALPQSLEDLAQELEFDSVEAMLAQEMGAGCTREGYMSYMYTSYYCNDYFSHLYASLEPTLEQIEAYYTENEETFTNAGVTKEMGKAIDARHILFIPEGGTATEDSAYMTYTDEAWEACRVKAQAVLDQYLAGERSENAFALLAAKHSADGSASNGGLISNILAGKTVKNFNDWIFDESRQYGDYGLVRTEFGYHIMYFVSSEDYWVRSVRTNMIGEMAGALIDAAIDAKPMEVDLDKVALSQADLTT